MLILLDFDKKYVAMRIITMDENAILHHIAIVAHLDAIRILKRLFTIMRLTKVVQSILTIKTIAWVSDSRNGISALIRSFLVCERRKNGITTIAKRILYQI